MEGGGRTWLVTHAGLHSCWLECVEANEYHSFIDAACADAWNCFNRGEHHFFLGRGVSRSDDQSIGGINWLDWDEMVPIPSLNQLVGHTPGQSVRYKNIPTSKNICLDTNLHHYAVFDGNDVEIKRTPT